MKYFFLFILFTCGTMTAQEKYYLDHLIDYDYTAEEDSISVSRYVLTNSNDNSYRVVVKKNDEVYELNFEVEGKFKSSFSIPKKNFYKTETFLSPCESIHGNKIAISSGSKNIHFLLLVTLS